MYIFEDLIIHQVGALIIFVVSLVSIKYIFLLLFYLAKDSLYLFKVITFLLAIVYVIFGFLYTFNIFPKIDDKVIDGISIIGFGFAVATFSMPQGSKVNPPKIKDILNKEQQKEGE